MDILTHIKPKKIESISATHESLGYFYKLVIAFILSSLVSIITPHQAFAFENEEFESNVKIVFEAGDHLQFLTEIEDSISLQIRHEYAVAKLKRQMKMNEALKQYLQSKRSPLAEYSDVILQQNNWKKILALSNAESTMCRRYIEHLANCWGVGGSNLWDMGDNLGQGIVEMNQFLNSAPSKSRIKYSQMNFEQMNGLYKQPPGDHWVYNNLQIYNELTVLERSIK